MTKWSFPAEQLDSGAFLLIFASEKDRQVAGSELHTNFKLGVDGEYRYHATATFPYFLGCYSGEPENNGGGGMP